MLTFVLLLFLFQDPSKCGDGYVKVWEEGRYVCEPEQTTVAVFEAACIEKVEVTPESKIYVDLDYQGKPDVNSWRSTKLKLTLKKDCQPHYETVKVHQ